MRTVGSVHFKDSARYVICAVTCGTLSKFMSLINGLKPPAQIRDYKMFRTYGSLECKIDLR